MHYSREACMSLVYHQAEILNHKLNHKIQCLNFEKYKGTQASRKQACIKGVNINPYTYFRKMRAENTTLVG